MSIYYATFPEPAIEHIETFFSTFFPAVEHVETPYSADNNEDITAIRHIIHVYGMRLHNEWFHYTIERRTLELQEVPEEEIVENATNISNLDLSYILSPIDDDDHYYIMEDDDNLDFVFD